MDELMDMITQDESPSGISDAIKDMLYAKSAEKIGAHKDSVANSLFGDNEPETEEEAELQQDIQDYSDRISGDDQNGEAEVESEPEDEE
tara:strand:+ start:241 stop:507 length:267 start_codon:yes stop_codon:yes gene_type:complete